MNQEVPIVIITNPQGKQDSLWRLSRSTFHLTDFPLASIYYDGASVNGRKKIQFFSAVFGKWKNGGEKIFKKRNSAVLGKTVEKNILNFFFCRSHLHHRYIQRQQQNETLAGIDETNRF